MDTEIGQGFHQCQRQTGDDGGPWTVTFGNAMASTNVAQMTASGASLTGGGGTQDVG
jgi:hypothetical protein